MNKYGWYIFVLTVVIAFAAMYRLYIAAHDRILEPIDVVMFKVEEIPGAHPTQLRISGGTSSSAESVYKVTTKTEGATIVVLVHAGIARKGTSGDIKYELSVPDSVSEVRFGHSSTLIWKRVLRTGISGRRHPVSAAAQ
jgi:hypothetical protein